MRTVATTTAAIGQPTTRTMRLRRTTGCTVRRSIPVSLTSSLLANVSRRPPPSHAAPASRTPARIALDYFIARAAARACTLRMISPENAAASLLVVDDNEDNREILAARLAQLGYTNVALATGGKEALERIDRSPVDLVLLDVMMPGVDGIMVLETLRAKQRLAQLPVIMVSAASEQESVVRCIELGAEDYLTKPVNATMLKARVGATLEKKRLRDDARVRMVELGHELAAARELQRGMVPLDHEIEGSPVALHFLLEPARELGGDLCDFLFSDNDTLWIGLGDVSGKGVAADRKSTRLNSS